MMMVFHSIKHDVDLKAPREGIFRLKFLSFVTEMTELFYGDKLLKLK